MNDNKALTIDGYRNLLIRYPDRLAMVFAPGLADAYAKAVSYAGNPEGMFADDTVLKGLTGGLSALTECGILGSGDAGRLMCAMGMLGGADAFHAAIATMVTGIVVSWYGTPDGHGSCTISREGVKEFRTLVKKWSGKGFGFLTGRTVAQELPTVFREYMKSLVDEACALVPGMEVRYSSTDGDGVADTGSELDGELRFILDCPGIAAEYYGIYLKALDGRLKDFLEELRRAKAVDSGSRLTLEGLKEYRDAFSGMLSVASGYAEGTYASPGEAEAAFREKTGYGG